jgi:hypothetical protein
MDRWYPQSRALVVRIDFSNGAEAGALVQLKAEFASLLQESASVGLSRTQFIVQRIIERQQAPQFGGEPSHSLRTE